MKQVIKKGNLEGYEIGDLVLIHGHITDPEMWHVTIRTLNIFGRPICKKSCNEKEIARFVYVFLSGISEKLIQIFNVVEPEM